MSVFPQVWDLTSLHPHPESGEFQQVLQDFRQRLTAIGDRVDSLGTPEPTPERAAEWGAFLGEWADVMALGGELDALAACHAAADAGNKSFRQLESQLAALRPCLEKVTTTLEFLLQATTDEELQAFVGAHPQLQANAFYLRERRKQARYRLPKEQELLLADLSVDGLHAWGRLYDRLSGDLRITVMEKGELVGKSPGQVQFDDPSRFVRENNFRAAAKSWQTLSESCADALNHLSGTRLTVYRRLGVRDHLELPLHLNRMRRETLETMWNAIVEFKPRLVAYLERKAKLMGIERPAWFDLAAPLPDRFLGDEETRITYDAACNHIAASFSRFSPGFGDFARMAIERKWIEAENRSGKRQGGFCTSFLLKKESRIFMTYNDTADNMSTLAHELGHAYHSWVLRDSPLLQQDYPMNLAETASTFAEAVLGEERLKAASPTAQIGILDGMLGDAVAFLMNIHARFLFEDRFHRERAAGELSPERFSELMLAAQKEAYLDALDPDGWYPGFWISKLHFYITYVPFYNFPYTFGYLLSLGTFALSGQYGAEFPERYRRMLVNTGCQQAEEVVRGTLDQDLTQPDFWRASLRIIGERVDRFLELTDSL